MVVLVEDAAERVSAGDIQLGEAVGIGDGLGQWLQGPSIGDALVQAVLGVELCVPNTASAQFRRVVTCPA
jgi:hypothetical protein